MLDLAQLKQQVDLRAIVPDSGRRKSFGRYILELCPFHDDDAPSLLVYANGYNCRACLERGDVIDWWVKTENIEWKEAITRLSNGKFPKLDFIPQDRKIKTVEQSLGMQYHLNLTSDLLEYYKTKLGFDASTVQKFQLGFGTMPGKKVGRFTIPFYENGVLVNIKGRRDDRCPKCFNPEASCKKQIRINKTTGQQTILAMWIICPEHGKIEHPDPDATQKYTQLYAAKKVLYNSDELLGWPDGVIGEYPIGSVVLVEGEYKAIALCQAGFYAVSFGAVADFQPEWGEYFINVRVPILMADNDPPDSKGIRPGWNAVNRVLKSVPQARVIFLPNPPKGDPVDYLKDHSPEELAKEIEVQIKSVSNNPYIRAIKGEICLF